MGGNVKKLGWMGISGMGTYKGCSIPPPFRPRSQEVRERGRANQANARVVDAAAGVYTRQFEHLDLSLNVSAWACDWRWH